MVLDCNLKLARLTLSKMWFYGFGMSCLITILSILLLPISSIAADPPMLTEYKNKVVGNLPAAYAAVDKMYADYFPTNTPGEVPVDDLPTLNKSAIYYDGAKVLHELAGLFEGDTVNQPDMYVYRDKINDILHEYYTRKHAFDGFVRFPHGLYYEHQETGNTDLTDAISSLANKSNWRDVNPANEWIAYTREVAYAIHVYITAEKAGVPVTDNTAKLKHFVDMALSHLNQWHTAIFFRYDTIYHDYRQAFMVGLTMNALIEYYEQVEADDRIPPAIKYTLDDLWNQQWQSDVHDPTPTDGNYSGYSAGYGAFWYWADWDGSNWVNNPNKMPSTVDLNADLNMIPGSAYAWYATYSDDETYMDKAVDIWKGYVTNGFFGYADILWQGNRYTADFLRWYSAFYDANPTNPTDPTPDNPPDADPATPTVSGNGSSGCFISSSSIYGIN